MNAVRDREDARWLPSRHHFALFRLLAFIRLRVARPQPRAGLVLIIDRDQSALENHAVASWIVLTLAGYLAAGALASWPLPVAIPAALLFAGAIVQVMVVGGGLLVFLFPNRIRANSILFMTIMLILAAYYARQDSWSRFVAWQFLAFVALNAIAAPIVYLLRGPIARLEAAFAA